EFSTAAFIEMEDRTCGKVVKQSMQVSVTIDLLFQRSGFRNIRQPASHLFLKSDDRDRHFVVSIVKPLNQILVRRTRSPLHDAKMVGVENYHERRARRRGNCDFR